MTGFINRFVNFCYIFFIIAFCVSHNCYSENCEKKENSPVRKKVKIEHCDYSLLKIKNFSGNKEFLYSTNEGKDSFHNHTTSGELKNISNVYKEVSHQKFGNVSLISYGNGVCLVRDIRRISVKHGRNEVKFNNFYPYLIEESISFRTPGKEKITVLDYTFFRNECSKNILMEASKGYDIFYFLGGESKLEKGKLLCLSNEGDDIYAIIRSTNRCDMIPLKNCIGIDGSVVDKLETSHLILAFEAEEDGYIDIEINYLIRNISWKHQYLIEVFEKLDRIDIYSQALISNDTDNDIKNVSIAFDTSSPNFLESKNLTDNLSYIENYSNVKQMYRRNISIGKKSKMACVLRTVKSLKPSMEYIVKIPMSLIEESLSKDSQLPVGNMLTIASANDICAGADFCDSDVLIFKRKNNERTFLGRQQLSSIKRDNDFVFEIGRSSNITARVQQIDFKKVPEKYIEYGVKLSLKNEKAERATVVVMVEVNTPWNIIKRNFDILQSSKPIWKIDLSNGELRDSYFRIRVSK